MNDHHPKKVYQFQNNDCDNDANETVSKTFHSILGKCRKSSAELNRPLKRSSSINFRTFSPSSLMGRSESTRSLSNSTQTQIKSRTSSLRRIKTKFNRSFSSQSITPTNLKNELINMKEFQIELKPPTDAQPLNNSYYSSESDEDGFDTTIEEDLTNNTSYNSDSTNTTPELQHLPKFHFYCNDNTKHNKSDLLNDLAYVYNTSSESLVLLDSSTIHSSSNISSKVQHKIFEIPEILETILRFVNENVESSIPQESKMFKRSPSSLNHSIIQYGNEKGIEVWQTFQNEQQKQKEQPSAFLQANKRNLYNCLLVAKLWNYTAMQIINEHLYFTNSDQIENFTSTILNLSTSKIIGGLEGINPKSLVLHKVKTHQSIVDILSSQISGINLKWLEYYICPNLTPNLSIITKSLQKLVLPGCKLLCDDDLKAIIKKTPNLKHLDLRACELITDASIWFIGQYCTNLELLNCGRHINGELITDAGLSNVIKNCSNLKTVGLAGCGISDWTIWELGLKNGKNLQRLSVNYCWKLTDLGLCKAIKTGIFERLAVLEIKHLKIEDPKDLVLWKRYVESTGQKVILEACERLDGLMSTINNEIDLFNSSNNISNWLEAGEN